MMFEMEMKMKMNDKEYWWNNHWILAAMSIKEIVKKEKEKTESNHLAQWKWIDGCQ